MADQATSTDLIISLPAVPNVATFTDEQEFDKLYAAILEKVNEHKHDVSTKKGRDEIKSHRKSVNNAIAAELISCAGISEAKAKQIVVHLASGLVPNVTLKY